MFLSEAYFNSHSHIAKRPKQLRCEEDSQALLLVLIGSIPVLAHLRLFLLFVNGLGFELKTFSFSDMWL